MMVSQSSLSSSSSYIYNFPSMKRCLALKFFTLLLLLYCFRQIATSKRLLKEVFDELFVENGMTYDVAMEKSAGMIHPHDPIAMALQHYLDDSNNNYHSNSTKNNANNSNSSILQPDMMFLKETISMKHHQPHDKNDASPVAILHIGPRKTGTTAIQSTARHYKYLLRDMDNMILFPHARAFAKCRLWNPPNCGTIPISKTDRMIASHEGQLRHRNRSIFLSTEELDRVADVDVNSIRTIFGSWPNIQVVYVYRRFFEWFWSLYGQEYRERWSDWNGSRNTTTNVISFFRHTMSRKGRKKFESYRYYAEQGGFDVILLNTHDAATVHDSFNVVEDDIVAQLFCHERIHTPNMCHAILETKRNATPSPRQDAAETMNDNPTVITSLHSNSTTTNTDQWKVESNRQEDKESTAYDEIAMSAYRAGLISLIHDNYDNTHNSNNDSNGKKKKNMVTKNKKMTRSETRTAIQTFHEQDRQSTRKDLPRICLKDDDIQQMEAASMAYENELFPAFFQSRHGKVSLQAKLLKYKTQGRFCAIDTKSILEDPIWKRFLSSL